MKKMGKKFVTACASLPSSAVSMKDAFSCVKDMAFANFNESVDLNVRLAIDPKISTQVVKGSLFPPAGIGRDLVMAVVGKGLSSNDFKAAGAAYVGFDDLVSDIQSGAISFDICFAMKSAMSQLSKVAKILGPKGLMPDVKMGTIFEKEDDLLNAVKRAKSGVIRYKNDKQGALHCSIGRVRFSVDDLVANASAFFDEVVRMRPATLKGSSYILSAFVSSTMGPSVKIDLSTVCGGVK
ncbi:50S ribosomal protein L1 [Candidatus Gromoviella agglomerans]|uniref:50S ribosomal protein L1 n=1 Tax=Candidatus Gromoviella agglomerans TaxID=2806609 RepID=UPI001E427062|nr:50S ribosomal protein L1 [Candidatus Gromoviella agglomerans]UFX98547.1 50S ribosomal protein L1 [Candidatus Gromoviella agglomerans]